MIRKAVLALAALPCALVFAQGSRESLFADADAAREAAVAAEAPLLAPEAYERGLDAYEDAEAARSRGRDPASIRSGLDEAAEAFAEAAAAAESARATLGPPIEARADALRAGADTFAAEPWRDAEARFDDAVRRLERGDIDRARSRAGDAESLYRDAELAAIKARHLSRTRALIAEAEGADVEDDAPRTLSRARELLERAERELNENRYDTDLPRSLAQQAEHEARHAIDLAERIRTMQDEDWELEDVILAYEAPLLEISAAADRRPELDRGLDAITADLVDYIENLRESERELALDLENSRTRIAELEEEIRALDEQLGGVSEERTALIQRVEAEERVREQFARVEGLFERSEARLSREGNEIVLRLVGLAFASGEADVDPTQRELLDKVREALNVFPSAQATIEGHTDSYGSDETNMTLSRRRAQAVSAYLSEALGVAAFRLSAVGYGETRPIANNETEQGRARNRRIDVRIQPQR